MSTTPELANLIETTAFSDWQQHDLSSTPGNWSQSDGKILQTATTTSAKSASGTGLIHPVPLPDDTTAVGMQLLAGSKYQAGLVFNFEDEENFSLFLINQYSSSYQGHRLQIVDVRQGEANVIHDLKEDQELAQSPVGLVVEYRNGGLVFYFDQQVLHRWEGKHIFGQCGLYSQQNDDAEFSVLLAAKDSLAPESPAPNNETTIETEAVFQEEIQVRDDFEPFLSINPPASETEVEFNEIFTVPLDAFYVSLFQNPKLGGTYLDPIELPGSKPVEDAGQSLQLDIDSVEEHGVWEAKDDRLQVIEYVDRPDSGGISYFSRTYNKQGLVRESSEEFLYGDSLSLDIPLAKENEHLTWTVKSEAVLIDFTTWEETVLGEFGRDLEVAYTKDKAWVYYKLDQSLQCFNFQTKERRDIALEPDFELEDFGPVGENGMAMFFHPKEDKESASIVRFYGAGAVQPYAACSFPDYSQYNEGTGIIMADDSAYAMIKGSDLSYLFHVTESTLVTTFAKDFSFGQRIAFEAGGSAIYMVNPRATNMLLKVERSTGEILNSIDVTHQLSYITLLDGGLVLLVARDGLQLLNLATEAVEKSLDLSTIVGSIYDYQEAAVHEGTSRLLLRYSQELILMDLLTFSVVDRHAHDRYNTLWFSNDGSKILGDDFYWQITDDKLEPVDASVYLPSQSRIHGISEDGKYLYARSQNYFEVIYFDTEELKIKNPQGEGFDHSLTFEKFMYFELASPDGRGIVFERNASTVDLHRDASVLPIAIALPESEMMPFSGSPDGNYAMIIDQSIGMNLWDLQSNNLKVNIGLPYDDRSFDNAVWLWDSQGIAITTYNEIRIYDLTGTVLRSFTASGMYNIRKIAVARNSERLVSISSDQKIRVWNRSDSTLIREISVTTANSHSLSVSPNGLLVAIQTGPNDLKVFEADSGDQVKTYEIDKIAVTTSFSEDSKRIVVVMSGTLKSFVVPSKEVIVTDDSLNLNRVFPLDYRPKTWYRIFKHAQGEETFYSDLSANYQSLITAHNDWTGLAHSAIEENLLKVASYKSQLLDMQNAMLEARDLKQQIIHEVRLNRYSLLTVNDTNDTLELKNAYRTTYDGATVGGDLKALGYNFGIIQGKPKFRKFSPIRIDVDLDFKDNDKWAVFAENFRKKLFASNALTVEKEGLFLVELEQLKDFDSNTRLIADRVQNATALADARAQKTILEGQDVEHDRAIEAWIRDKSHVQTLYNGYDTERSRVPEFIRFFGEVTGHNFEKFNIRTETTSSTDYREVTEKWWKFWKWFSSKTKVTITYYTYVMEHYLLESKKPNLIFKYKNDQRDGNSTSFSPGDVHYFLAELIRAIDKKVEAIGDKKDAIDIDLLNLDEKISSFERNIEEIDENGLQQLRKEFIRYWNDPEEFGALDLLNDPVRPDSDPVADLLELLREEYNVEATGKDLQLDYFHHNGRMYINQDGLSIPAYLKYLQTSPEKHVAFFPTFNESGSQNNDLFTAVVNPRKTFSRELKLPVIKFIETYTVRVRWVGPHLGELSHAENLFPGETKEIILEKSTELTRRIEQTRTESELVTSKTTNSFEENLTKELTQKDYSESSKEDSYKQHTLETDEDFHETVQRNKNQFDLNLDITAKKGAGGAPGAQGGGKSSGAGGAGGGTGISGTLGMSLKIHRDKDITDRKKKTFEKRNEQSGKTANKETREAFSKDLQNVIRKVVNETSQENKVEIKVNVSESFSQKASSKETVSLENPNQGRTVNYNFYQVQNRYEVETYLTDVKILVDTNEEQIMGSGITDIRIYELEELGKIFIEREDQDDREVITAAIIARQAFKNYLTRMVKGVGQGNGALDIPDTFIPNMERFQALFFSRAGVGQEGYEQNLMSSLREALAYLKTVPFQFKEVPVHRPAFHSVNAGAYYLDSEVGKRPATEKYLEERREIETRKKVAEVEHLEAQTQKGIFYRDLPDSLSNLNLGDSNTPS